MFLHTTTKKVGCDPQKGLRKTEPGIRFCTKSFALFFRYCVYRKWRWVVLRKPEPELRRRRPDGDAVPTDATAASLGNASATVTVTRQRFGGLARHVPNYAHNQDAADHGGRHQQHKPPAKALPRCQSVRFHRRYHHQVQRRQIPRHHVRYPHLSL